MDRGGIEPPCPQCECGALPTKLTARLSRVSPSTPGKPLYMVYYILHMDLTIICESCGQEFVFTEGEQEYYRQRELDDPKLCMICRARKQAEERDRLRFINKS